jgi:tetratricopeptide (TPR) repeat protein
MRRFTRFAPFSQLALLAAISALGVTVFAASAHAAPPAKPAAAVPAAKAPAAPDKKTKDLARKAYGEGEKAYAAGDFSSAYTGFSKANELIPSAQATYWATKSLDQVGRSDEAIKGYETLLADPNNSKIGDDKLADARARLAALKAAQVGEITVSTTAPGAVLLVDGAPQPGPLPTVLKLSPGPHKLTLTAEGYDAKEVDLQVQAGTQVQQSIEMLPHTPPPPPVVPVAVAEVTPPPPPPEKQSKVPAYVTLGIAAGGAVVGTIFGVKALSAKSDFDSNPTAQHADDTERNALIADMAFGVALTLGVTGIVLLTSNDEAEAPAKAAKLRQPPKATFRVLPYMGRESGGATARLTF